jgi:hypothetical protein
MAIPMIKVNGKMVPAKKVNGKWEPIPESELVLTEKGFQLKDKEVKREEEE